MTEWRGCPHTRAEDVLPTAAVQIASMDLTGCPILMNCVKSFADRGRCLGYGTLTGGMDAVGRGTKPFWCRSRAANMIVKAARRIRRARIQQGLLETIYRNYETTHTAGLGGGAALTGHRRPIGQQTPHKSLILVRSRRQPPNSGRIALKKCFFPLKTAGIVQQNLSRNPVIGYSPRKQPPPRAASGRHEGRFMRIMTLCPAACWR
jgi:hypothetical protein